MLHRRQVALTVAALLLGHLAAPATATTYPSLRVTQVEALFRDGQTFITWKEDGRIQGEVYRVYRHTEPITPQNISKAKLLAEVPEGSSRFQEMWKADGSRLLDPGRRASPAVMGRLIPRLVIEPVQQGQKCEMLAEDTGLFVWTVKDERPREYYYAVKPVLRESKFSPPGDWEDPGLSRDNTAGPIREVKQPIGAVKYYVEMGTDKKTGQAKPVREWYIMWMDYELWNAEYVGYAFPFAITPAAFKPGGRCPSAHLDGIGTMNVFTAGYTNYGCGDFSRNALPTWYFGYGTKVKNRARGTDVKQEIANYVQYRILQTVLWARRKYKITDPRFVINGNSMGASGAIGFALAYPKFVTAIWANEGLTDYADTMSVRGGRPVRLWQSSIFGNYGKVQLANPARFLPFGDARMDWALKFNGENVYNVRNAAWFLNKNVGEDFPFLNIGHCWQDGSIPAKNQAVPFEKYIRNSRHCFSYTIARGGHGWGSAWGNGRMMPVIRWDESRPGFSKVPCITGWRYGKQDPTSHTYMYKAAWGVKEKPIQGKAIEETETSWALPILHATKAGEEDDYAVDITPRNLQKLRVLQGDKFSYEIKSLDGKQTEASGEITADEHNLLLIPKVPIRRSGALVTVKLKQRGPKFQKPLDLIESDRNKPMLTSLGDLAVAPSGVADPRCCLPSVP